MLPMRCDLDLLWLLTSGVCMSESAIRWRSLMLLLFLESLEFIDDSSSTLIVGELYNDFTGMFLVPRYFLVGLMMLCKIAFSRYCFRMFVVFEAGLAGGGSCFGSWISASFAMPSLLSTKFEFRFR